MPSPSPICTVNSLSTASGIDLAAGAAYTIQLVDLTASRWTLHITNTDDGQTASTLDATLQGSINNTTKTATGTMPSVPCALQFTSTVYDSANSATTTTFVVHVLTAGGLRLVAFNETTETGPFGHAGKVNAAIKGTAGAPVSVSPIGGTSDDWPALATTMAQWAYKRPIVLAPGTYHCKTRQFIPSGTHLILSAGVTIDNTGLAATDQSYSVFTADAANFSLSTTTLASTPTVGGTSLVLTAAPAGIAVGSMVRVQNGATTFGFQMFEVIAWNAGTKTVTTDRTVIFPFAGGDAVTVYSGIPQDIIIEGNGAIISGTGGFRAVEFTGTRRCRIRGLRHLPTIGMTTELSFAFDVAGYDNQFIDCEADGNNIGNTGFALESQENSHVIRCQSRRFTVSAMTAFDCLAGSFTDCRGSLSQYGCAVARDGASAPGCLDFVVKGGVFDANTTAGIGVINGSQHTQIIGASARYNPINLQIGDSTSAVDTAIIGGDFRNGTTSCINVGTLATGTRISGCDVSGSPSGAYLALSNECFAEGLIGHGAPGAIATFAAAAYDVVMSGCRLSSTNNATNHIEPASGVKLTADDCVFGFATSGLVADAGSIIKVSRTRTYNAGAGTPYSIFGNGGQTWIGDGNDFGANGAGTGPAALSSGSFSYPQRWQMSDQGAINTATRYLANNGTANATEANVKIRIVKAVTLVSIQVDASAAPGVGHSTTYKVRKNGVDTALLATLGAADTTKSGGVNDTGVGVAFAPGDYLSISQTPDGAGNVTADPRVIVCGF